MRERRMARLERWQVVLLCACGSWGSARAANASTDSSVSTDEPRQVLGRLEIVLVGDVEQDPVLFERIRSLFPPQTAVVLREVDHIERQAVLLPQRADTLYLWIRVSERTKARVYLALGADESNVRYLFRELELETGLDEVGSETLAEVAHSSARALWLHERQTPRHALIAALERDVEPQRPAAAPIASSAAPDAAAEAQRRRPSDTKAPLRLGLGLGATVHASGVEGWLYEPGGFLAFEYLSRLSLRVAARYLVPTDFEPWPARVRLSGASGEFRAGWLLNDARPMRVRVEAGLGVFWGHAQASISADDPNVHAAAPKDFERAYALAAAAFEWPLGPAWIAAGADLRVPFRATSYEVVGQSGASVSPSLSPGGSLELGIGFDPVAR